MNSLSAPDEGGGDSDFTTEYSSLCPFFGTGTKVSFCPFFGRSVDRGVSLCPSFAQVNQCVPHFCPGAPFQVGFQHPGLVQIGSSAEAATLGTGARPASPQVLPHFCPGAPFQVGFPHPGLMQTAGSAVAATLGTSSRADSQVLPHFCPGAPFQLCFPHPGLMQTASSAAPTTSGTGSTTAGSGTGSAGPGATLPQFAMHFCQGIPFHVGLPQPTVVQNADSAA